MVSLLNSEGTKNCKSRESFCLSTLTTYQNDWSTILHGYRCHSLIQKIRAAPDIGLKVHFLVKKGNQKCFASK